ncbi:MAG TPA: UDP-N-acetylmuramate--L-alanine ligase [Candidatus Dormibacteraeota bacterium]|nr:UDP-N-acetylmuramate--L-alanine ligase [Candidatus Dormibacteraeota bacterium]
MKIHFVGIGGAGCHALAEVLLDRGEQVSGCDRCDSPALRSLAERGATISLGHDPAHVRGRDLVVYSTAVRPDSEELVAARASGARTLSRPELLAELIAGSESVTVAGTHGKTTVTLMLGRILTEAGFDPTVLVGDHASSRAGGGAWLVAEADESDRSLTLHRPRHGVLTNVEFDHANHFRDLADVEALFRRHLEVISGVAVVCADDARARAMAAGGRRVTYGFAEDADYRCLPGCPSRVLHRGRELVELRLGVPGRHNLQNATAALALAVELGVDPGPAAAALAGFRGAHRRLERLGRWRGAVVYDDYGHHPTEVRATVAAAREITDGRVILVFQPHRYSRFLALRDQLACSLKAADAVVVVEIYAAGEEAPAGVSAAELAERVPGACFAPDLKAAGRRLEELVRPGDLVLVMGAGDVWRLGHELADTG